MDNTIVNIALPSIGSELHASISGLQWTIDAYVLVLASLLMLSGSTADRLGRRRTFQVGLAVFTVGSLLCSLAPGLGWLVAFRMVQAVGGSMLNPVAMSIITNVFTERRERAMAIGVWGGVIGISFGVGPVVGGLLVQTVGWRSIFWINIPIGVAALVLAALFVPESKAPHARRPDAVGQVAILALLAGLTYAIIESPRAGWTSPQILGVLGVAAAALALLLWYEPRRTEPLLELRFFRSVPFAGATVIALSAFGSLAGFLFLTALYLQDARGLSALDAGLCLLPIAASVLVIAPLSGRIVGSSGPRVPLVLAGALMTLAGLLLTGVDRHTPIAVVLVVFLLYGIGFGFVNAPITTAAVSGMPNTQAGVAAAIASTSRQIGGALGVAVVGTVLNSRPGGASARVAFDAVSAPAWSIVAGCGLVVLVLGIVTTSRWATATTARTSYLFRRDEELTSV